MKAPDHKKGSVQKRLIYEINYTFLLYLIFFSVRFISVIACIVASVGKTFLSIDFSYSHRVSSSTKFSILFSSLFSRWIFLLVCLRWRHLTFWYHVRPFVCFLVAIPFNGLRTNERFTKLIAIETWSKRNKKIQSRESRIRNQEVD